MTKIFLVAILLSVSLTLSAKSEAEMPTPKISIHQASNAAEVLLLRSEDNIEPKLFLAEEYIVQSINFSKVKNEWVWVVRFMHPKAKDYKVTYHVDQDGSAKFEFATD
ncbi:hypothetical protein [Brumicola pallidula]|jgi:hypothetical protein|uniref:PepSY domain-containing protein n=1 Tax=Brumicola pallidula DSM 14239 = ACAM 615 TaxID=1121922 RepID=K6ZMQ9_9ALTE|nr:hypothetical protein [Glaciecola pallidula]GAC30173.1 hypothetical protein GPAL_3325 [Glaciecola pallidula DSM 14239 = ACAM 615]